AWHRAITKIGTTTSQEPANFCATATTDAPYADATETKHLVTVLPAEHKHHLDTRTEPLAELMDLRKDSSLSALLRQD
ncbi:hypothetical protein CK516_36495, partial [Nostoc sp. 'Peltigera malacea cyanobiont' DB3992]